MSQNPTILSNHAALHHGDLFFNQTEERQGIYFQKVISFPISANKHSSIVEQNSKLISNGLKKFNTVEQITALKDSILRSKYPTNIISYNTHIYMESYLHMGTPSHTRAKSSLV